MSVRLLHDQKFCASQIACDGTPIRPDADRTECPACERAQARRAKPATLRGARDKFTMQEGRKRRRAGVLS